MLTDVLSLGWGVAIGMIGVGLIAAAAGSSDEHQPAHLQQESGICAEIGGHQGCRSEASHKDCANAHCLAGGAVTVVHLSPPRCTIESPLWASHIFEVARRLGVSDDWEPGNSEFVG